MSFSQGKLELLLQALTLPTTSEIGKTSLNEGLISTYKSDAVARFENYERFANWPSALGQFGNPLEFSVVLGGPGQSKFRLGVDPTDHKKTAHSNWRAYLSSLTAAGVQLDSIALRFVALLLSEMQPLFRSRLMYAIDICSTYSLKIYIPTKGHSLEAIRQASRFQPSVSSIIDDDPIIQRQQKIHLTSIDFDPVQNRIGRIKFYNFVPSSYVVASFQDSDEFNWISWQSKIEGLKDKSGIVRQLAVSDHGVTQKFNVPAAVVGMNDPRNFLKFLDDLQNVLSINLRPYEAFLDSHMSNGFKSVPSFICLDSVDKRPHVTVYSSPFTSEALSWVKYKPTAELTEKSILNGAQYLEARQENGSWTGLPIHDEFFVFSDNKINGKANEFLTAFIASEIESASCGSDVFKASSEYLRERLVSRDKDYGIGWNQNSEVDLYATSLAALALNESYFDLPSYQAMSSRFLGEDGAYSRFEISSFGSSGGVGSVEVTATILRVLFLRSEELDQSFSKSVQYLISCQRQDGGWPSDWWLDDRFACLSVLRLFKLILSDISRSESRGIEKGTLKAIQLAYSAAMPSISAAPIEKSMLETALWGLCWLEVGGSLEHLTLRKACEYLQSSLSDKDIVPPSPIAFFGDEVGNRPWSRRDGGFSLFDMEGVIPVALASRLLADIGRDDLSIDVRASEK